MKGSTIETVELNTGKWRYSATSANIISCTHKEACPGGMYANASHVDDYNGIKFYVASPEDGGYCGSARVPSACKASVFQFRDVCLFLCFRLETHVVS